jgi:hypothetical protein
VQRSLAFRGPTVATKNPPEEFSEQAHTCAGFGVAIMARPREELWPVIAVSVSRLADALSIERREIYEAIKADLLPCYRHGTHRRILIVDAIEWVRNTWKRERV